MNTITKLSDLAKAVTITAKRGEARLAWDKRDQWQMDANDWRVTLKYQGRQYSLDYWQGTAIKDAPTAESVLECLLMDAQGAENSFEDFCANAGYDTDSRKAERIYRACLRSEKRLRKLLGADYQAFVEAEQY